MYSLQSHHRGYKREDKKHAPQGDWFLENQYAYDSGSYSPNACPDGVGCTYGDCLDGFGQEYHAENVEKYEGGIP